MVIVAEKQSSKTHGGRMMRPMQMKAKKPVNSNLPWRLLMIINCDCKYPLRTLNVNTTNCCLIRADTEEGSLNTSLPAAIVAPVRMPCLFGWWVNDVGEADAIGRERRKRVSVGTVVSLYFFVE